MGADAKRKEARKRKFGTPPSEPSPGTSTKVDENSSTTIEPPKKKTKQAFLESQSPGFSAAEYNETGAVVTNGDAASQENEATQKAQRFIVFIGNLPYTATDDSVKKHFAKVRPNSIRHRTEKEGGKSKGFAFLEFEDFDRMKTCLKLYHNSSFDDEISPTRKLNVELTAGGGGGKSKDRRSKLQAKNERLNEQRKRRAEEEEKQTKTAKNGKLNEQAKGDFAEGGQSTKTNEGFDSQPPVNNGDIHPSRRSRVATLHGSSSNT